MAELKTKLNDDSVEEFLNTVEDEEKRTDCFKLVKMMEEVIGEPAKMCLYVNRLSNIAIKVLRRMVKKSIAIIKKRYR
jgi:hypothetical protein